MIETKFKKTELGSIPEDWNVRKMGEIGFTYNGLTGKKADDFGSGFSKYITFLNVLNNPIINISLFENVKVTVEEKQNVVKKNDLFFNTSSETPEEVGTCSVILNDVENLYLNSFCFGYRLVTDDIFGLYLSYYFRSKLGRSLMSKLAQGSTRYNLSKNSFLKASIALPPTIHEQQRIAEVLNDVDTLILSLGKMIEKKRNIKLATMQQLLTGKQRLPGFTEPWEEKKLGEVATVIMGQSPSSSFYNIKGYGLPLIQGNADIGENRKQIVRYYTSMITKTCQSNTIIMSVRAPVGSIGKSITKSCIGRGVCAINYENDFIYHFLVYFEPQWGQFSKGSTFDSINGDEVRDLPINMPSSLSEQITIADILTDMDNEIAQLEARKKKYEAIKQGMMQQILTGKIRLI
ncbi:MAG: restriction endonuclease subunit S [Bacteroidales bacterium]|nr:restriction endonuclease subunit S [Bacteroidales bacterium]